MIRVAADSAGKVHLHAAAVAALRNAGNDGAYYSGNVIRVHCVAEGGEGERVMQAGTRTRGNTLRHTQPPPHRTLLLSTACAPSHSLGMTDVTGDSLRLEQGRSRDEVRRRADEGEDTLSCGRIALARGGLLRRRAALRRPVPPPEL